MVGVHGTITQGFLGGCSTNRYVFLTLHSLVDVGEVCMPRSTPFWGLHSIEISSLSEEVWVGRYRQDQRR